MSLCSDGVGRSAAARKPNAFEQFDGIGVQDLPCALARIDSEQDRN